MSRSLWTLRTRGAEACSGVRVRVSGSTHRGMPPRTQARGPSLTQPRGTSMAGCTAGGRMAAMRHVHGGAAAR